MNKYILIVAFGLAALAPARAATPPPALKAISADDLRNDLYSLADARFRGRGAGTVDELNAAAWIAEKYRAIGLQPAGDNGTYFQYFTMWRNQLAEDSRIEINHQRLELWSQAAVAQMANVTLDGPIIYLGNAAHVDLATVDVAHKIVALEANPEGINLNVSLPTWRYGRYIIAKYGVPLLTRGAAAIIFIADDVAENAWTDSAENYKQGTFDIEGGPAASLTTRVPVIWLHREALKQIAGGGATIHANLVVEKYPYPSVNVIGKVAGRDARLKSEYVLYSGHTDAHGVRNPIKGDAIYHGADDNGSVDVAMFADARAFVKSPARRSVLFVIHGAEERGLLGSRYYAAHPTVPITSIVAVLNGDMIGRNDTNSAAVLGAVPPHRNSTELVEMALAANREGPKFTLDSSWDDVKHVEGWYFRSDHLPYARLGIPALMYTSLLHPDYHTPQDSAENINYPKLKKMAEWMYRTGWKVANADQRPGTDKDFKLER